MIFGSRQRLFSGVADIMLATVTRNAAPLISAGKSGQVPSASLAHAVIAQLRPQLAIMTGFCGGVARRISLGDVAMFTSAAAWDYGKWEEGADGEAPKFLARPDALNIPVGAVAAAVRALSEQCNVFSDSTTRLYERC